jgi:CheY-like chemotaxis protein
MGHRQHKPDMVLLDVMMPMLDGWTVLRGSHSRGSAWSFKYRSTRAARVMSSPSTY